MPPLPAPPDDLGRPLAASDRGNWRLDADPRLTDTTPNPATGYEGASMARRLSPWRPNRAHINTNLATEGPLLRARTRQLVANSPYGSNASETFVSYATGAGIKPSSLIADQAKKAELEQLWTDWTDEADADGLTDFYGLQSLAARALFDAGEVFVRLRPRFLSDGLSVPMQLQLLEAEQLDNAYTVPSGGAGNNAIRSGIEFDAIGRRVAYHFWRTHPGDSTLMMQSGERVRVPAENVLHIYKPLRPGQIRGRPWLTAAMVKLYDLDQYDDAELARKKSAAFMMGFIKQDLNSDIQNPAVLPGASETDAIGQADLIMEPMTLQVLPPGFDITWNQQADVGPNYAAFQLRQLYALCAAMGLPYHAVTGDVSNANYSSLRAAEKEAKRRIDQFQWETLIFQLCRPVWQAWLPLAVASGAISLPGFARQQRAMMRVKWMPPKWEYVNPLDDVRADKIAVDAGFKARSDVIEEHGDDAVVTDNRIAAERQRERDLGIAFAVGLTINPDKPAGNDQQVVGSDQSSSSPQPGDGNQPPDQQGQQPQRAAQEMREAIVDALSSQPPTTVNVHIPGRGVERTRVTKYDENGRIQEFEREEVA
jgi:lambda family phage portal protein